jgi:hypothetical protein
MLVHKKYYKISAAHTNNYCLKNNLLCLCVYALVVRALQLGDAREDDGGRQESFKAPCTFMNNIYVLRYHRYTAFTQQ